MRRTFVHRSERREAQRRVAEFINGLIDAHVHLREPDASLALFPANGVTTVVNLEG